MIRSIEFFDSENGYLNKKATKYVLKKGFTEQDYIDAVNNLTEFRNTHRGYRHPRDLFYKEKEDGYANDRARNCLLNRKIDFVGDKINLIFGPNASGKSTIIKTIANYAMCGSKMYFDGFTNASKFAPLDYPFEISRSENKYSDENLIRLIESASGNKAKVDWDGNPVYYHAFDKRMDIFDINNIEENILGGMGEQLAYMKDKNSLSDGKQSLYIFSKLFNIAQSNPSLEQIIESTNGKMKGYNDSWIECYENSIRYLNDKYCGEHTQNTILLDEIDKSLDINNVAYIFKDLLPALKEINNQQIIVISHSPLVLSEDICSPEKYNFISMDEDYTAKAKNIFSTIEF